MKKKYIYIALSTIAILLITIFHKKIFSFVKKTFSLNARIIALAKKDFGLTEIKGKIHNTRIVQYFKDVGQKFSKDEIAWCAAFVGAILKRAGAKYIKTAWAEDYLKYPNAVTEPKEGDIVIFSRHVGFYISDTNNQVKIISGNMSDQVKYSDENKSDVLGYRRPQRA